MNGRRDPYSMQRFGGFFVVVMDRKSCAVVGAINPILVRVCSD